MFQFSRKSLVTLALGALFIVLLAGASGSRRNAALSSCRDSLMKGLIHWWKFSGNCYDSVGELNANPIGPVSYTAAPTGQGIVFDGVTTGIGIRLTADMRFQGSYSISVWACLHAYTTTSIWSTIIFEGDDRPGLDPFYIQVDPHGNLQFQTRGLTRSVSVGGQSPFPLNQFVFIAGTYNAAAGTETLYVNGKPVMQVWDAFDLTPVVPLDPGSKPGIGIGTNNDFPNSAYNMGWNGVISDLRVYNRALSAGEVGALYRPGARNLMPTRHSP